MSTNSTRPATEPTSGASDAARTSRPRRPPLWLPRRPRSAKLIRQLDNGGGQDSGGGARRVLPRGIRLRLTVVIPLVVMFLVGLGGILALWVSYPFFLEGLLPPSTIESRLVAAFAVVAVFSLVSLLIGIRLALSITRPLRELTSQVQSLRPAGSQQQGQKQPDGSEIDQLGSALEGVVNSFSTLMLDSYTLRSLEGGVVTMDPQGIVTSCNAVAEEILECQTDQAIGKPARGLLADDPANNSFLAAIRAARRGVAGHFSSAEAVVINRQGHPVQLGYTLSPLRDEDGGTLGLVLTFKDLAEHKVAEQAVRRTESLALIGAMATNVAHEIRNPLGAMSGLVEMIREASDPGAPAHRYANRILDSIERINRICQELLTVGNPEPRNVESLDINGLVRKTLEFSRYDSAASKNVTVRTRYAADLPRVPGDGERLGQVLLNILRNAYQACKDGGEVTLTTRATDRGVAVAIHNTGPHIPAEKIEKLFTVFYTTKTRGTGLGLAISQQLVRAHGGRILVDSGPERGTTFTIELPLVGPPAASEG